MPATVARAIAEAARRIGSIPELAEPLASGRIGTEATQEDDLDLRPSRGPKPPAEHSDERGNPPQPHAANAH
jgi:hypothetical protein